MSAHLFEKDIQVSGKAGARLPRIFVVRVPDREPLAVTAWTRGNARGVAREYLKLDRLPVGTTIIEAKVGQHV